MKKTNIVLLAIVIGAFTGCMTKDSHDVTTNNHYYGNTGNNNGQGSNNNGNNNPPDPPVSAYMDVIVKMNGMRLYDGNTYQVGARTLLDFSWNQLPSNCNEVMITVEMSDVQSGVNLLGNGNKLTFHTTKEYHIVELPTDKINYNCTARIKWKVEPLTCSGRASVEGYYYFTR